MKLRIALAGNPNCGKTTLFNALTGSNQYVGNWAGVTVEKKEGALKGNEEVTITDLPGIYSLSPYTLEEVVARNYLVGERPDAILNIVDGTNLERNLYLTTQLIELGIPVVVAINMMDIVRRNGDTIDINELGRHLGCSIVEISALKGDGILESAEVAIEAAKKGATATMYTFSGLVEHTIAHIEEAAVHHLPEEQQRWYAIKIFERDEKVIAQLGLSEETLAHIESDIRKVEEKLDDDADGIITNERYVYIVDLIKKCYVKKNKDKLTLSDKIDSIVTNRILALPIFAIAMWFVYFISIGSVGAWATDFMNDTVFGEWVIPWVTFTLERIGCAAWLVSLIADGIVGGVGAVLGFVPQMFILFMLLSLLEDCGYMARVAFIMDRIFRKFGLSGKSFIPMLVATGCGVPGIMASRTIEQDRERKMTIMTTGFIPCGAKTPLIAMTAAAFFGGSAWIATSAYFMGIVAVVITGIMLKKTKLFAGDNAPFIMELPAYHAPVPSNVIRTTWDRGWSFVKRAGSVILVAGVIIWILNSLSLDGGLHYIGDGDTNSILNVLGGAVAVIFKPIGFGTWQAAVATILGLMAKEEVVGVFGTLAAMAKGGAELGEAQMYSIIANDFFGGSSIAGFSFMAFNLLCAPCFAAMGAIKREMNNWKWSAGTIAYMCVFAYAVSLMIYQFGIFFTSGIFTVWTAVAMAVLAFMLYMLFRRNKYEVK